MTVTPHPMNTRITPIVATADDLTNREVDVVTLVTNGLSNQEIADRLYLSINSVKTYIRSAYRKIGATSRSQAVIWGVRNGMLDHRSELTG